MSSGSSHDRTARWVQAHSSYYAQPARRSANNNNYSSSHSPSSGHRVRTDRLHDGGLSSQQSSRTDLGGHDFGVGVGAKHRSHGRSASAAVIPPGAAGGAVNHGGASGPLSSGSGAGGGGGTPRRHPPHHRARSASASHTTPAHQAHGHVQAEQQATQPRFNIHSSLYRHPQLPAFVQGPPGSGYPMAMSTAAAATDARAAVPSPPSPPIHVPTPLNPKKSRPTVQRRRPSLSGATFDPPPPEASYAHGAYGYATPNGTYHHYHHGPPDMSMTMRDAGPDPRPRGTGDGYGYGYGSGRYAEGAYGYAYGSGSGSGYRSRARSASEVRRVGVR